MNTLNKSIVETIKGDAIMDNTYIYTYFDGSSEIRHKGEPFWYNDIRKEHGLPLLEEALEAAREEDDSEAVACISNIIADLKGEKCLHGKEWFADL